MLTFAGLQNRLSEIIDVLLILNRNKILSYFSKHNFGLSINLPVKIVNIELFKLISIISYFSLLLFVISEYFSLKSHFYYLKWTISQQCLIILRRKVETRHVSWLERDLKDKERVLRRLAFVNCPTDYTGSNN